MALFEDFLQVTIDAVDVSDYVLSYSRNNSMCEPGTSFVLGFTRKKPDNNILEFSVSDPVLIYEKYPASDLVLKGFITNINVNANNVEMRVQGMDKYVLLTDYFIPDRLETTGQSVAYWISYICGLVNLSVQFDATPGIATDGADGNGGTPLGMQTAGEAIATLERKGAVYTRYDSDLDKIVVYTLTDAQPKVTIDSDNLTTFDRNEGTELTRNVVKVWGGTDFDWATQQSYSYSAVARATINELVVDQTTALANPEIRSQTFANIVASRILAVTATLDDIVIAECAGLYPSVKITNNASINISQGEVSYRADRMITSKGISVTRGGGAETIFTFGEKCPRMTISPPPYFVYASYEGNEGGAAISYNSGDSFSEFNQGLPTPSGVPAQSIAANAYNQLMLVTTSGIYRRSGVGDVWNRVTALDTTYPSNDEGEDQILPTDIVYRKVEKEAGFLNRFHLLGQATGGAGGGLPWGQERWWAYFTPDFGYTWSSMQLYTPGSGLAIGTVSGLSQVLINGNGMTPAQLRSFDPGSGAIIWNVHAHDMEGDINGNVTVIVEGDPVIYIPPDTPDAETFHIAAISNRPFPGPDTSTIYGGAWAMDGYTNHFTVGLEPNRTAVDIGYIHDLPFYDPLGGVGIFSVPNNREVAYFVTLAASFGFENWYSIRTKGEYYFDDQYDHKETDIPEWEYIPVSPGPGCTTIKAIKGPIFNSYYFLYDYSSLKSGTTTSRWLVLNGSHFNGANSSETKPTGDYLRVGAVFFSDDIDIDKDDSCTACTSYLSMGATGYGEGYDGDGLFGWTNIDPTTVPPVPRSLQNVSPSRGGADLSAITSNKGGSNKGYAAFAIKDIASKHGDGRDDNCDPEDEGYPNCYPRDFGENVNVGIVVSEFDFDSGTVSNISVNNFNFAQYYDSALAGFDPADDDAREDWRTNSQIACHMVNPNLIWVRTYWSTYGTYHEFWISYPSFSIIDIDYDVDSDPLFDLHGREGVLKVPYFGESMIAKTATGRGPGDGSAPGLYTDTTKLYRRASTSWVDVDPPPISPIGEALTVRQNPYYGVCITERREVPSGSWDTNRRDYHFMWKAQRSDPTSYTVMGSNDDFLDPYAEEPPPEAYTGATTGWWDFRTAAGSYGIEFGGGSATWNFVG